MSRSRPSTPSLGGNRSSSRPSSRPKPSISRPSISRPSGSPIVQSPVQPTIVPTAVQSTIQWRHEALLAESAINATFPTFLCEPTLDATRWVEAGALGIALRLIPVFRASVGAVAPAVVDQGWRTDRVAVDRSTRPGSGNRPGVPSRPGVRPSAGDLGDFLGMDKPIRPGPSDTSEFETGTRGPRWKPPDHPSRDSTRDR